MLNEIPVVKGQISKGCRLFPGSSRQLVNLGIVADEAVNPLTTNEAFWIAKQYWKKVESANLNLWAVIEFPIRHLEAVLRKNLSDFVGHQEVMNLLEASSNESCNRIQKSRKHITKLVLVIKALLDEEVPITEFEAICSEFEHLYRKKTDVTTIVERIRMISKIRQKLPGNNDEFWFYQLGERLEASFRNSISKEGRLSILHMEPTICQDVLTAVRNQVESRRKLALIVQDVELRPFIRKIISLEFPYIPVLSRQELRKGFEAKILGAIELQ
jgi:type III secretory pathway component EscV